MEAKKYPMIKKSSSMSSLDNISSLPNFSPTVFQSRRQRDRLHHWNHLDFESVVSGVAHLCFPESGAWFQGNLVSSQDCIYKVSGRIQRQCRTVSLGNEFATQSIPKRKFFGSCETPKKSFLDSEEPFFEDFEPADDEFKEKNLCEMRKFSTFGCYTVTILDFETGSSYFFKNIQVKLEDSVCWISDGLEKKLRFKSSKSFIGTSADLLVNSQLGPSFVKLGLKVYKGQLRFCHKDPVCSPDSDEPAKWCF